MKNILIDHSGIIKFHPFSMRSDYFFRTLSWCCLALKERKTWSFFEKLEFGLSNVKILNVKTIIFTSFFRLFFLLCNIRRSLSVSSPFLTFLAHFTKRKYEVHAYIMRNTYTSSTKTKWNCKWSQFHETFKYQSDFWKKNIAILI